MSLTQTQNQHFILLLSSVTESVNVDRHSIRQACSTPMRALGLGKQALELLERLYAPGAKPVAFIDCIICTERLDDMNSRAFLQKLKELNLIFTPPVLGITGAGDESTLLALGASSVLERPYTIQALGASISRLAKSGNLAYQEALKLPYVATVKPEQPLSQPAIKAENTTPAKEVSPLLYARTGERALREGKLVEAENYLLRAVRYDSLDVDSCLQLARLYNNLDDTVSVQRWLHRAGSICERTGQHERAASIFSRLPQFMQEAEHEILETQFMLEEGDYEGAAASLTEIANANPGTPMHRLIARVCQLTSSPEANVTGVCAALENRGMASTAQHLRSRLLDEGPVEVERASGWLSRHPRLNEVVAVARFTMQAWKSVA